MGLAQSGIAISGALLLYGVGQSIIEGQLAPKSPTVVEKPLDTYVKTANRLRDPIVRTILTVAKIQEYVEVDMCTEDYGYDPIMTKSGHKESRMLLESINIDAVKHDNKVSSALEPLDLHVQNSERDAPEVSHDAKKSDALLESGMNSPVNQNLEPSLGVETPEGRGSMSADKLGNDHELPSMDRLASQLNAIRRAKLNGSSPTNYDRFMSNVYTPIVGGLKETLTKIRQHWIWLVASFVLFWGLGWLWAIIDIKIANANNEPDAEPKAGTEQEQEKERDHEKDQKTPETEYAIAELTVNTTAASIEESDMGTETESDIVNPQETGHPNPENNDTTISSFMPSKERERFERGEYKREKRSKRATDRPTKFGKRQQARESQEKNRVDNEDLDKFFEGYPFRDIFLQLFEEFQETRKKANTASEVLQQGYIQITNLANTVDTRERVRYRGENTLLQILMSDSETVHDVLNKIKKKSGDDQYEDIVAFCIRRLMNNTRLLASREDEMRRSVAILTGLVMILMVLVIVILVGGAIMFYGYLAH